MPATIEHIGKGFEVNFNEFATSPEVNQTKFCVLKSSIQEVLLNKGELYEDGLPILAYTLNSGREYYTHAGVVRSGIDGGVVTWFTDDDTENGTPDTNKLYLWVKDRYLQ